MSDLLLKNVRPLGAEATDILIRDGKIAAMGENLSAEGVAVEDGAGHIVVPAMVEAHTHLDKTTWGMPWYQGRKGGVLQDLIDNERNERNPIGLDVHRQSMRHAIGLIETGSCHIRSHVDIDTDHGLSLLEGKIETRNKLKGLIDIEIVAFPQSGLMVRPGTDKLMEAAMEAGADVVGGLDPSSMDRDPKGQLDFLFALADKHGAQIDIHLHEPGELGAFTMEEILNRTEALGMQGKVGVSHAFCLGSVSESRIAGLVDRLAKLDVAIFSTGHASATTPSLAQLRAAGVRVGIGCDGIRDTWGPWGDPDMLERARLVGMKNRFRRDDELELLMDITTTGGAASCGRYGHEVKVGARADLTLLTGETLAHAVVLRDPRPLVIKGGKVVARAGKAVVEAP